MLFFDLIFSFRITEVFNNRVGPNGSSSSNHHETGETLVTTTNTASTTAQIKNELINDSGCGRSHGSTEASTANGKRLFGDMSPVSEANASMELHGEERSNDDIICGNFPKRLNFSDGLDKSKSHKCVVCDYETTKIDHLRRHSYLHTDNKPFKCEICTQQFIRKKKYKKHLEASHGHVFPYKCTVCEEGFEREAEWQLHESRTQNYRCDVCSKTFKHRKDNLEKHMRTHGRWEPQHQVTKKITMNFNF